VVLKTPGFFTAKYTKYAKFYLHDRINKIYGMEFPGKLLLTFLIFGIIILFILFILSERNGRKGTSALPLADQGRFCVAIVLPLAYKFAA
jgi:hypothetical protein